MTEYCKHCGKLVEHGYFGKSEECCSFHCAMEDLGLALLEPQEKLKCVRNVGKKLKKAF